MTMRRRDNSLSVSSPNKRPRPVPEASKGLRYNEGKLRYDLLPPRWMEALAEVMTKGAEKYEPRNWEKGMEWSKCYASLMRHTVAWLKGEDIDPESGLPHMAHTAWNALALVEYAETHPEYDDRTANQPSPEKRPRPTIGVGADRPRQNRIWSDPLKPSTQVAAMRGDPDVRRPVEGETRRVDIDTIEVYRDGEWHKKYSDALG